MSTRQDYIAMIDRLVGAEKLPLGTTDKVLAINSAIKTYSKHKPKRYSVDITGSGADTFDYSLSSNFTYWSDGFSLVYDIEYPLDTTTEEVDLIPKHSYTIYESPSGKSLRFLVDRPLTTETIRVWYSGLYFCTDDDCNIDEFDEEAVQMLAASVFCTMLATVYAETQDNTITADSVDHSNKAKEYSIRARIYKQLYSEHIGVRVI